MGDGHGIEESVVIESLFEFVVAMRLTPSSPPGRPKTENSARSSSTKKSLRKANKTQEFSNSGPDDSTAQTQDTGGMIIFECAIKKKDRYVISFYGASPYFPNLDP